MLLLQSLTVGASISNRKVMKVNEKHFKEHFVSTILAHQAINTRHREEPVFNVPGAQNLADRAWEAYLTSKGIPFESSRLEVDYEGMGTCINADFRVGDERMFTISAAMPEHNDRVQHLIKTIQKMFETGMVVRGKI